jgi:hypothetical protein
MWASLAGMASGGGGGGMSLAASSSADGDNAFDNAFSYKNGTSGEGRVGDVYTGGQHQKGIESGDILLGVVAIAAVYVMVKGRK